MLEVSYDIPNFNVNDVYECVRHNDERMVLWNDDQPKKKPSMIKKWKFQQKIQSSARNGIIKYMTARVPCTMATIGRHKKLWKKGNELEWVYEFHIKI